VLIEPFLPRAQRKYLPRWRIEAGPVPWVTGACALVDVRIFDAVGGMDEAFFLYYEEVALCRAAWRRGHRVEFDPSVDVVHLRPLQNRRIDPTLRVVTRHSRLVYFAKFRPGWEFWAMVLLTRAEAQMRARWASRHGRLEEAAAWARVEDVARRVGRGERLAGTRVRDLARGGPAGGSSALRGPHARVVAAERV
jgi:GT2 family glycosyltransferase